MIIKRTNTKYFNKYFLSFLFKQNPFRFNYQHENVFANFT